MSLHLHDVSIRDDLVVPAMQRGSNGEKGKTTSYLYEATVYCAYMA
jgi:hypothetical protein